MKKLSLMLTFAVLFSYTAYSYSAVENIFIYIFQSLPASLQSGTAIAVAYFRFFLFIIIFAGMHIGAKKVFPDNNRIATTIALVAALISVWMMPSDWIMFIVSYYKWLYLVLFLLIPLVALYLLGKVKGEKFEGVTKWTLAAVAAMLILVLAGALQGMNILGVSNQQGDVFDWIGLALVLMIFA